jgi:Tfp pilus assembly protein PilO
VTRTRTILVLGSLILAGLIAISWLFVLSPRMDRPAAIAAQTEAVQAQTSRLQGEVTRLTAVKRDLPARVARFGRLRGSFPTTAELPAVLNQIRASAQDAGVTVQALESSAPVLVAPASGTAAPDAATPDAGAAAGQTGQTGTPAAGQPAAPAASAAGQPAEGSVGLATPGAADGKLATMPMSVTVSGSYASLSRFLGAAEHLPRAWLIDTIDAQGGQESGAAGEITLTASGNMFVLDTTGIAVPGPAAGADG